MRHVGSRHARHDVDADGARSCARSRARGRSTRRTPAHVPAAPHSPAHWRPRRPACSAGPAAPAHRPEPGGIPRHRSRTETGPRRPANPSCAAAAIRCSSGRSGYSRLILAAKRGIAAQPSSSLKRSSSASTAARTGGSHTEWPASGTTHVARARPRARQLVGADDRDRSCRSAHARSRPGDCASDACSAAARPGRGSSDARSSGLRDERAQALRPAKWRTSSGFGSNVEHEPSYSLHARAKSNVHARVGIEQALQVAAQQIACAPLRAAARRISPRLPERSVAVRTGTSRSRFAVREKCRAAESRCSAASEPDRTPGRACCPMSRRRSASAGCRGTRAAVRCRRSAAAWCSTALHPPASRRRRRADRTGSRGRHPDRRSADARASSLRPARHAGTAPARRSGCRSPPSTSCARRRARACRCRAARSADKAESGHPWKLSKCSGRRLRDRSIPGPRRGRPRWHHRTLLHVRVCHDRALSRLRHAGAARRPATRPGDRRARGADLPSTSFVFEDTDHAAALFNMERAGHVYSRISNPTSAVLEERIAALEGGVGAIATASGQAALHLAIATLMGAGAHIVASSRALRRLAQPARTTRCRASASRPPSSTRATSTPGAPRSGPRRGCCSARRSAIPASTCSTFRAVARLAHEHGLPLLVDSTFTTPWLMTAVRARRRPRLPLGDQVPRRPRRRDRRRAGRRRHASTGTRRAAASRR